MKTYPKGVPLPVYTRLVFLCISILIQSCETTRPLGETEADVTASIQTLSMDLEQLGGLAPFAKVHAVSPERAIDGAEQNAKARFSVVLNAYKTQVMNELRSSGITSDSLQRGIASLSETAFSYTSYRYLYEEPQHPEGKYGAFVLIHLNSKELNTPFISEMRSALSASEKAQLEKTVFFKTIIANNDLVDAVKRQDDLGMRSIGFWAEGVSTKQSLSQARAQGAGADKLSRFARQFALAQLNSARHQVPRQSLPPDSILTRMERVLKRSAMTLQGVRSDGRAKVFRQNDDQVRYIDFFVIRHADLIESIYATIQKGIGEVLFEEVKQSGFFERFQINLEENLP